MNRDRGPSGRIVSSRVPSPMGWAEGWNAVGARNLQLKTGDCRHGNATGNCRLTVRPSFPSRAASAGETSCSNKPRSRANPAKRIAQPTCPSRTACFTSSRAIELSS